MKVGLVCNEYPPAPHGGIGTFVSTFAKGLVSAGHKVLVVGISDNEARWNDNGVEVVMLRRHRVRKIGWLLDRIALRSWLQNQVRRGKCDIVETPDFDGLLPFGVCGVPSVARLHMSSTAIAKSSGRHARMRTMWCERRTLCLTRNWIAVSRYAAEITKSAFRSSGPERINVVYNPIEEVGWSSSQASMLPQRFILHAGYVSEMKGALRLAEAARDFLRGDDKFHVVFAGTVLAEGDRPSTGAAGERRLDDVIRNAIGPLLAKRCHFLGHVDREVVRGLMRAASAFVFPSRLETFGLVVAEAMLEGCPVVVPNWAPFNEYVVHENNGLLCDGMDPRSIAAAVNRVLANPEWARRLGDAAQATVRTRFSVETCVAESVRFYEQCIAEYQRGSRGRKLR